MSVDTFYIAVLDLFSDRRWRSSEEAEKTMVGRGYSLRETCRIGAILEDAVEEKLATMDVRRGSGPAAFVYQLNASGVSRLEALKKPPAIEKKERQRSMCD
jgi:hypothetical protein